MASKPKNAAKKPAAKPPPKAVGRPRMLNENLPEDWRNKSLDAYEDGYSDKYVYTCILKIGPNTFNRLIEESEDFRKTILWGRDLAEGWWEKQIRKGLWMEKDGARLNVQLVALVFRNRFKWDSKTASSAEDLLTEIVVDYIQSPRRNKIEAEVLPAESE